MIYALVIVLSVGLSAACLALYLKRDTAPPPAQPITIDIEAFIKMSELVQSTVTSTAKAIGEAVAASLVAPPVQESQQQTIERVAHDIASDIYGKTGDVDDMDPTDLFIGTERTDTAAMSMGDAAPFGVPGLRAVAPDLAEVVTLNGGFSNHPANGG